MISDLLTADDSRLDRFTIMFRHTFRLDLQETESSGRVRKEVWQFIADYFESTFVDTQEVEGANKIIKII